MTVNVGERVRRLYETRPYPRIGLGGENPLRARLRLAPLDWIRAVWQPAPELPRRILVAGCGTGAEAFTLARRFPDADIDQMKRFADKRLSLTACVSFETLERLGLGGAFTFDRHFRDCGFRMFP